MTESHPGYVDDAGIDDIYVNCMQVIGKVKPPKILVGVLNTEMFKT